RRRAVLAWTRNSWGEAARRIGGGAPQPEASRPAHRVRAAAVSARHGRGLRRRGRARTPADRRAALEYGRNCRLRPRRDRVDPHRYLARIAHAADLVSLVCAESARLRALAWNDCGITAA